MSIKCINCGFYISENDSDDIKAIRFSVNNEICIMCARTDWTFDKCDDHPGQRVIPKECKHCAWAKNFEEVIHLY
jgi:hypothetical protein